MINILYHINNNFPFDYLKIFILLPLLLWYRKYFKIVINKIYKQIEQKIIFILPVLLKIISSSKEQNRNELNKN